MRPANERRRYNVTSSLIGWAHTQDDSCITLLYTQWTYFSLLSKLEIGFNSFWSVDRSHCGQIWLSNTHPHADGSLGTISETKSASMQSEGGCITVLYTRGKSIIQWEPEITFLHWGIPLLPKYLWENIYHIKCQISPKYSKTWTKHIM